MELKTKYQYTYFIYPYIVEENRYSKYILKLLKDKRFNLKTFQKAKDANLNKFFLPRVREFLFSSLDFSKAKLDALNDLNKETASALLSKNSCVIFEYNIKDEIQGKTGYKNGIFFKIERIEIICFNSGICFLCIKTNIEDSEEFSDVLNFNYKFRDINQEYANLEGYDNIRIQTNSFEDITKFRDFIKDIIGLNLQSEKLDIDTERFLTYSYVCVDQSAWNSEKDFDNIKSSFNKFVNVLPNDNSTTFERSNVKVISYSKYAKIGIGKQGMSVFSSTTDINNYTTLPQIFECEYFYTYILVLYKKIYLKKLGIEFKTAPTIKETRKKFIQFTKNLWIQEVSSDNMGEKIYNTLTEVLELDMLYYDVKNKYDILYKELNIEKDSRVNRIIAIILAITLIFNILNFIVLTIK